MYLIEINSYRARGRRNHRVIDTQKDARWTRFRKFLPRREWISVCDYSART